MTENVWLFLVASAATLLALAVLALFRRSAAETDSADELPDPRRWAEAIEAQLPAGNAPVDPIRAELHAAGYYRPGALRDYLIIRGLLTVAPLIAAGMIAFVVGTESVRNVMIGGVIGAILGFSLPRVLLIGAGRTRQRRIAAGLPVSVDLLVLSLSAGLSVPESLRRTATEVDSVFPELGEELRITAKHANLHSLDYAMARWSDRSRTQEVRTLSVLLIQSERLGTNTVETLQEFSGNFRTLQRQKAEAKANRTSFWMLFPTIFCLWIAAAIVLVGPPYLEFWQYREEQLSRLVEEGRENIEQFNQGPGAAPPATPTQPEATP